MLALILSLPIFSVSLLKLGFEFVLIVDVTAYEIKKNANEKDRNKQAKDSPELIVQVFGFGSHDRKKGAERSIGECVQALILTKLSETGAELSDGLGVSGIGDLVG